jgi:hypothetical protein
MTAKYVIVNGRAIVFSAAIVHKTMVKPFETAEGAGFVRFFAKVDVNGEVESVEAHAFGKSESLEVSSRPEDSRIITNQITNPPLY